MNGSADYGNIWQQLQLAWRLWRDRETPFFLKLLPLGAVLYWLFPLEGLGLPILATPIDDVAVLYVALTAFINLAPPALVARHRATLQPTVVEGEWAPADDPIPAHKVDADLGEAIVLNPDKHRA